LLNLSSATFYSIPHPIPSLLNLTSAAVSSTPHLLLMMEKLTDISAQEQAIVGDGIPETGIKAGTVEDREAMRRLGKQQLFKVSLFQSISNQFRLT
jgi:hypothetical protein